MDQLNHKNILLSMSLFTVTLLLLFFAWKTSSKPQITQKVNIQIAKKDWVKGAKSPEVTLVEYSDFQCPACGAYYPLVKKVNEKYKEKIRFVYRHFPLAQHKNALLAAQIAEAAGLQNKFWQMHDMLFENQAEWSESNNVDDIFEKYAKSLKLDVAKFRKDLSNESLKKKIDDDRQSGLSYGVNSTPTFYLNGVKLDPPPQNMEEFDKLLEASK